MMSHSIVDAASAEANHSNHPDDAADSRSRSFLTDPWSQGVLTGVLTLIPARSYPIWLRRSIIWGPTVIGAVLPAYLGASPEAHRRFTERMSRAGQDRAELDNARQAEPERSPQPEQQNRLRGAAVAAVAGGAIGAVLTAAMAVAFWGDEKAEQGLRRLRVPFPRVVMGAAAGASAWWSVVKENERERPAAYASQ